MVWLAACGGSIEQSSNAGAGGGSGVTTSENHTGTSGSHAGASGSSAAAGAGKGGSSGVPSGRDAGKGGSTAVSAAGGAGASAPSSTSGGAGASAGAGALAAAGSSGTAAGGGGGDGGAVVISGPSKCEGSELLFCEDFEGDSVDSSVWSTLISAPEIDATRAARGGKSLLAHTGATGAAGITTKKIFPRPEGHYYGRLFVYFDALPTSPTWAHWTIVGANPVSGKGEIRVGGQQDEKIERWGVGTDQGPTGDWTNLDKDPAGAVEPVALKEWLCVEWLHDWENDVTRFYLDGVEHPSLATTADVKHGGNDDVPYEIPELGSVWVGFWNYDQNKPVTPDEFDVWIDEVALDVERIGCER